MKRGNSSFYDIKYRDKTYWWDKTYGWDKIAFLAIKLKEGICH
jgi:hypothetical protein